MMLKLKTRRRSQRGQSAIIALLVMLLLAFIGGLFITIVARNLRTEGRSHRTLNADYYAEAGLRYADEQLTASLDGADWRPPLQNQVNNPPADAVGLARYNALVTAGKLPPANQSDPDYAYLNQGFTRYNMGNQSSNVIGGSAAEGGRFLLRVTYDPIHQSTQDNPTARYLKIEVVGREGRVDTSDPTTYQNQPVTRLAATLVAFKPIGITDYARFETDIDNRSDIANLGVPSFADKSTGNIITPGVFDFNLTGNPGQLSIAQYPILVTYGAPDGYLKDAAGNLRANPNAGQGSYNGTAYTPFAQPQSGFSYTAGGGSIRANMNLRLYGENIAYLNRPPASATTLDDIEVAGNLLLDSYDPSKNSLTNGQRASLAIASGAPVSPGPVANQYPSNDPTKFSTQGGAVRDGGRGANASDANGDPRSVARLDPPVMDNASTATGLNRYQTITQKSPPRIDPASMTTTGTTPPSVDPNSGAAYPQTFSDGTSAGSNGYGQTVYIDNTSDIQRDSTSVVGGHTLMDEWLNANGGGQTPTNTKGGWVGGFYNPPGAEIVLGPQRVVFGKGATAVPITKFGFRITRSDVDTGGNPILWKDPNSAGSLGPTMAVSYDELRASNDPTADPAGLTPAQLAAYNANPNNDVLIYAEGNVRVLGAVSAAPSSSTDPDDSAPRHVTIITNGTAYIDGNIVKGNPDSSITILAHDYVCVNTTQFLAGAAENYPGLSDGLLTFNQDADVFIQEFSFGLSPAFATPNVSLGTGKNGGAASPLALYVSGGAGASGSVIADFDITDLLHRTSQDLPAGFNSPNASLTNSPSVADPTRINPFDNSVVGGPAGPFSGLFDSTAGTGPSLLTHRTYDLSPLLNYGLLTQNTPQSPLQLWVKRDTGSDTGANPTATSATPDQPFQLERSAILPMDIRIEAVLYAQNKSFFVIPGPWFNSDSGDTIDAYFNSTDKTGLRYRLGNLNSDQNVARYPFYGQPLDLKITLIGAVSEARPADINSQAAWMQKWGWIPRYHGSEAFVATNGTPSPNFEPSGRNRGPSFNDPQPALGLSFIYDPQAGYPYDAAGPKGAYYLRSDIYGRPLPVTPKLPVSTGLLYAGQSTGPSLLP